MIATTSIKSLIEALRLVRPASKIKATLPILMNVKIEAKDGQLWLTTNNLEAQATVKIDAVLDQPGATTVELATLEKTLGRPDKARVVTLETDKENTRLSLSDGKIKSSLLTLPVEEFPPSNPQNPDGSIQLDAQELHQAIRRVQAASSKDPAKPVLCTILIENKDSHVTLCASNGGRLHLAILPTPCPVSKFSWIYPASSVKLLANLLARTQGKVSIETFSHGDETILKFVAESWSVAVRLVSGKFPDFNVVIPPMFKQWVVLNRQELVEAVATLYSCKPRYLVLTIDPTTSILTLAAHQEAVSDSEISVKIQSGAESSLKFGVNPGFLKDALKAQEKDTVILKVNYRDTPFAIADPDDPNYFQVIMPMYINE